MCKKIFNFEKSSIGHFLKHLTKAYAWRRLFRVDIDIDSVVLLVANLSDSGRESPNFDKIPEVNGKISTLLATSVKNAKITKK